MIYCFTFTINLSAQADGEMAQAYYKKAKTAYQAKKYEDAQNYIEKSLGYNIPKSVEPLTYLAIKVSYDQKKYEDAYPLLEKYFALDNLKSSDTKIQRYQELVSIKVDIYEKVATKTSKTLNKSAAINKFDNGMYKDYYSFSFEATASSGETLKAMRYRIGKNTYQKETNKVYFKKRLSDFLIPNQIKIIATLDDVNQLAGYIQKNQQPKAFSQMYGRYYYSNNGEMRMVEIKNDNVYIYDKNGTNPAYRKKNDPLPFLVVFRNTQDFEVTKSSLEEIGDAYYKLKKYQEAFSAYLEAIKTSPKREVIFDKVFSLYLSDKSYSTIRKGINKYFDLNRIINYYIENKILYKTKAHYRIKKGVLLECKKWYIRKYGSSYPSVKEIEKQINNIEKIITKIGG